jgi:hypothetical protein
MTPCPRDADLKNGKTWATKTQQDWPVNVAINNRLLICKTKIEEALYYAKPELKVDPYF